VNSTEDAAAMLLPKVNHFFNKRSHLHGSHQSVEPAECVGMEEVLGHDFCDPIAPRNRKKRKNSLAGAQPSMESHSKIGNPG